MNLPEDMRPVVALSPLNDNVVSSYLTGSQGTSQEPQNGDSDSGEGYSDEELPVIGNMFKVSPKPHNKTRNSTFDQRLKEIAARQHIIEQKKETDLKMDEMWNAIKNSMKENQHDLGIKSETTEKKKDDFLINNELGIKDVQESKIPEVHPGEPVLDFYCSRRIFNKDLTFTSAEEHKSPIDEWLREMPTDMLEYEIERGSVELHFERIHDKKATIRLLFRLMSIHDSDGVALRCKNMLYKYFRKDPDLKESISLKDIIEVFLNYGSSLERLIPVPELRTIAKDLCSFDVACAATEEKPLQCNIPEHCLEFLIATLQSWLHCGPDESRLSTEHAQIMAVMLCRVALDRNLQSCTAAAVEIPLLLRHVLEHFSEDQWPRVVVKLAQYFCFLSEDAHNLVAAARLILHSERGCRLQKLASYCIIHKLLQREVNLENINDLKPPVVSQFLASVVTLLKRLNNNPLLYHIISLIDLCVNCDSAQGNWQTFDELSATLKQISTGLRDGYNEDAIKISDIISITSLKWSIYAKQAPRCQTTMFSYLTLAPPMEVDS